MSETTTRVFIVVVVLACIGGLVFAVARTREGDPQPTVSGAGTVVELLIPANGDEVVNQHSVAVDLDIDWTADLIIQGQPIPEAQLHRRPELGQVIFEPGEGRVFERLPAGQVCATAVVWPVTGVRTADSRSYDWCFQVT